MINKNFTFRADKLKKRRRFLYLTQRQAAERIGISRQYYNHLENGYYNNPSFALINKLAKFFKVKTEYFFK